ncbi:MAG: transport-associated protein [Bryobacterales bacterium]|nr:transport-associated protein [Bryobacterales bacterium]
MKYKFVRNLTLLAASVAPSLCAAQPPVPVSARRFSFAEKAVSDDSIYDYVKRKLANDQVVKGGALEIDVKEGVVTLRGTVDTEQQKQRAEKLAKKVKGVKKVDNEIKLSTK